MHLFTTIVARRPSIVQKTSASYSTFSHAVSSTRCKLSFINYRFKGNSRRLTYLCASRLHQRAGDATTLNVSADVRSAQNEASARLPRFFHDAPLPQHAGARTLLSPSESKHALRSLRLSEGDCLELCDGSGKLLKVRVVCTSKAGAEVEAEEEPREAPRQGAQWEVVVACGSLKGGRADWLVEKCSELGAQRFTPLITERSSAVSVGRTNRLERVALAAAKQSLRTHTLLLDEPLTLAQLLPRISAAPLSLLAAAGAEPLFPAVMRTRRGPGVGGLLIIGPEGDFTPGEVDALVTAGATLVGLGPLRLRAETAAISLLSGLMLLDS